MKGWPEVQTRRLFRVVNGGTPPADPGNWDGDVPWATPVDLGEHNGRILEGTIRTLTTRGLETGSGAVPAGSLLLSTRAPIGYVAESCSLLAFNQGCRGLVPLAALDTRFYRYVFAGLASRLRSRGQGSTFVEVSSSALGEVALPWPDQRTQRAIADYLDTETARIDALITKKRRMIQLLGEWLDAYIRNRLAPVAPRLPLKRRWMVVDCKHRTPDYVIDGYPVVSPGDVTPGRLDLSRAHRFVGNDDLVDLADQLRRPRRGDVIYSRNASIGIASYVDTDEAFCMGQDVCRITSSDQDQLFLTYVLNSVGVDQLDMQKIGSTFSRVNIAQIAELAIPAPPPTVQRALAADFDSRSETHAGTVGALRRQAGLLQERRQALITAAVTGQLDIPGAAA